MGDGGASVDGFGVRAAVEDGEDAGVETEPVEIGVELAEALAEGVGVALAPYLELKSLALPGPCSVLRGVGPAQEQIDATAADTVLPVDIAAAVDDAL